MNTYRIYYFNNNTDDFQLSPNGTIQNREDIKIEDLSKVIKDEALLHEYYFITTTSTIDVDEHPFPGTKTQLTHIYKRSRNKLIQLEDL